MSRKFKNIASIILLLIFLLPSVIKLGHHHEHFVYDSKSEKNSPVLYGVCGICNFEFFVFLSDLGDIDLQNETPLADYCNNYNCLYYSNPSQYSYLLRAPPG
jgi:hypothetical protein